MLLIQFSPFCVFVLHEIDQVTFKFDLKILSHLLHWADHVTSSVINLSLIPLDIFFLDLIVIFCILSVGNVFFVAIFVSNFNNIVEFSGDLYRLYISLAYTFDQFLNCFFFFVAVYGFIGHRQV